jgi:hypothetical protein
VQTQRHEAEHHHLDDFGDEHARDLRADQPALSQRRDVKSTQYPVGTFKTRSDRQGDQRRGEDA